MKVIFYALVICLALCVSLAAEATEVDFSSVEIVNNSKELEWLIKGGNQNLYLVSFYMPGDNHEEVKADLQSSLGTNAKYKDIVTYVEVNAARRYQYQDLLQEIGIYNEPSSMYPYVLLMKAGEGYLFRGVDISDMVNRKIESVIDKRVNFDSVS